MRVYRPHLWAALCACLLTVLPGSLRAELIAYSGETQVAEIRPLEDGRAAVSFVWRVGPADKERFNALAAGLRSVVRGGTASRSPQQIARFVQLKGVRTTIAITRQNLTLTLARLNSPSGITEKSFKTFNVLWPIHRNVLCLTLIRSNFLSKQKVTN